MAFVTWLDDDYQAKMDPMMFARRILVHDDPLTIISRPWIYVVPLIQLCLFAAANNVAALYESTFSQLVWCMTSSLRQESIEHTYLERSDENHAAIAILVARSIFDKAVIRLIYDGPVYISSLRRVMVAAFCASAEITSTAAYLLKELPQSFLADVIKRKNELDGHRESVRDGLKRLRNQDLEGEEIVTKRQCREAIIRELARSQE